MVKGRAGTYSDPVDLFAPELGIVRGRKPTDEVVAMGRTLLRVMAVVVALGVLWVSRADEGAAPEVALISVAEADQAAASPIEGVWIALQYVLASGDGHTLRGRIFFSGGDWTVVFFVLDEEGAARRASAEGGTYSVVDDVVTFRHEYNFSRGDEIAGMAAAELRMDVTPRGSEAEEPTRFSVDGSMLTLFFPSGNRMTFEKSGM